MSEWKPGDVRQATVNGERMLVLRGRGIFEGNWYPPGPVAGSRLSVSDSWLIDDHPLAVIDPESSEDVERLAGLLWRFWETEPNSMKQATLLALREFTNPTPPRPEEPTGLGAVVEDADGDAWVLIGPGDSFPVWAPANPARVATSYDAIAAVRVLSEGVHP